MQNLFFFFVFFFFLLPDKRIESFTSNKQLVDIAIYIVAVADSSTKTPCTVNGGCIYTEGMYSGPCAVYVRQCGECYTLSYPYITCPGVLPTSASITNVLPNSIRVKLNTQGKKKIGFLNSATFWQTLKKKLYINIKNELCRDNKTMRSSQSVILEISSRTQLLSFYYHLNFFGIQRFIH